MKHFNPINNNAIKRVLCYELLKNKVGLHNCFTNFSGSSSRSSLTFKMFSPNESETNGFFSPVTSSDNFSSTFCYLVKNDSHKQLAVENSAIISF